MDRPLEQDLIVRGSQVEFKKILVAYDGSEHSAKALRMSCALASKFLSKVIVVNVYSSPAYAVVAPSVPIAAVESVEKGLQKRAEELVRQAVGIARSEAVEASGEALKASSAVEAITRYARMNDVDLIVLGTRGLTGFRKLVVGSVSGGVAAHAHCPVLVVK